MGDTCWFFSSINIFLTSDNGLKILWKKLKEFYSSLNPAEKYNFNKNIRNTVVCHRNIKRSSVILFWKFLNQYICAIGGPGSLLPTAGLNTYLTKNIKWRHPNTRNSKGKSSGLPHLELPAILSHLGFKAGTDFRMVNFFRSSKVARVWTTPVMLFRGNIPLLPLPTERFGYELTSAIIYVHPANSSYGTHVWACTIRNGKGYICDSELPTDQSECSWWLGIETLKEYSYFYINNAKYAFFDVVMYTRKDFTNKIAPSCMLPPNGYRPLTLGNEAALRQLTGRNNGISNLSGNQANAAYTPRVKVEVLRQTAISANVLNRIVRNATSVTNGIQRASNARNESGRLYRVNQNSQIYKNFKTKLSTRFTMKRKRNANTSIYQLGNKYYSANGVNMTNRINKKNWIPYPNHNTNTNIGRNLARTFNYKGIIKRWLPA